MAESMKTGFELDLEKKLDELIVWTVLNSEKEHRLSASDFSKTREQFYRIATSNKTSDEEAEPSEGGAQYVNVTPAPWP